MRHFSTERGLQRIMDAIESEEYAGFCISCGEQSADAVEPDARGYNCHACGKNAVYGAEEILMEIA